MDNRQKTIILEHLAETLELPDSAYEAAKKRYESIGEWLGRDNSACARNQPHIFPQGSFMLGTAVRPIDPDEAYDVDLGCSLTAGLSTSSISQEQLKQLVGGELETYRIANGVDAPLEEKHRCWRLEYADDLKFHVDIVPCIPETQSRRTLLAENMAITGLDENLARNVAELSVSITDDRYANYSVISNDWLGSNPEGYAKWFEAQVHLTGSTLQNLLVKAQVDELPLFSRKSPLQRAIQILKRHRDTMFTATPDPKPISIIITTLVAKNYSGSQTLAETVERALNALVAFAASDSNEVRNPVDPQENFADRWTMPQYNHLQLKRNFHLWVQQVEADYSQFGTTSNLGTLQETFASGFSTNVTAKELGAWLGVSVTPAVHTKPTREIDTVSGKPWYDGEQ